MHLIPRRIRLQNSPVIPQRHQHKQRLGNVIRLLQAITQQWRGVVVEHQEVREYAANQQLETIDAEVAQGLAEQAERFKQEGSQLYKKV